MLTKLKPKSEFSRNVLTLMTGTTIAQAIPIAISPILTRIYTPEDFGVFALYIGISSIISTISTGKYELAIMLPKNDEDAINVAVLSLMIAFVISFISFLLIFIFNSQIVKQLGNVEIANWLYFIPITVLLTAIYQNLNYWSNRNKNYKDMSKTLVLQSSSSSIGNLSFGFLKFAFAGLILANIIGSFISSLYLMLKNIKSIQQYIKDISIENILIMSKKYKQFPAHTLPQNFIYQGNLQLPIFVIKTMFSFTTLGFFTLAYRVIVTPLSVVGNSLGQVFYQKASIMYKEDKDDLYLYIKKLFLKLLLVSLLFGSGIVWALPDLFSFFFGIQWLEAGNIAQYLMIYLIFDFALTPFTKIYLISNNNIFYLKWEVIRLLAFSAFFSLFYIFKQTDSNFFFIGFSIINLLLYFILAVPILNKKSFIWREN